MDTELAVELGGIFLHNGSYDYDSDYTYEDELEPRGAAAVLVPVLVSFVLAVGVPGHALVMAFLFLKRQCWSTSDIFILHLGLSDVLLLVTLPFWAAQVARPLGWCCGLFLCRINGALFNISFFSGALLLVCVSAERYLSIVRSVQLFTNRTPRLAHIACVLLWVASVLLSVPDLFSLIYVDSHNDHGEKACSCVANEYRSKWLVPSRVIHHVAFLLPVAIVITTFYFILSRLQESTKAKGKLKSVKLIPALVAVFFLCWTPYNITLIIATWKSRSPTLMPDRAALLATLALACIHGCLRPLVYFALCGKFRDKALATVTCRTGERDGDMWELGVGSEAAPDRSCNPEEMKQMNQEQQLQSGQC